MTITQAELAAKDSHCDFCYAPLVGQVWCWAASPFRLDYVNFDGDWVCCSRCYRLLVHNDYRLLFQRIVKLYMEEGDGQVEADMRARFTLKIFKDNRLSGPPHLVMGRS